MTAMLVLAHAQALVMEAEMDNSNPTIVDLGLISTALDRLFNDPIAKDMSSCSKVPQSSCPSHQWWRPGREPCTDWPVRRPGRIPSARGEDGAKQPH